MKTITTNKKVLLNAVATANNYTSKDGEFAGTITLNGVNGQMEVKATDMIQTIVFKNIAFVSSDLTDNDFAPVTLDGKKFSTVLKVAKADEVAIEFADDHIVIKSGRSRARIETMAKVQDIVLEKGYGKSLDLGECFDGMRYLTHAIDANNPKFELNGLLLEADGSNLIMAATDTRRLATVSKSSSTEDVSIILPKEAILTLNKLFSGMDIEAEADEHTFSVYSPFVDYETKLISGEFPDFQRIIPKIFSHIITLDTKQFAELITEASIFEQDIIINVSQDEITASDLSGSTEAIMPRSETMRSSAEFKFAVNSKYILDVLTNTSSEEVDLCFNETNLPFMLKVGGDTQEVIMPVTLPEENEVEEAA